MDKVYEYYKAKYLSKQTHQQTSSPPWCGTPNLDNPISHPTTSDFTTEEIAKVLISLPNNKACGADGVTYELLKATKQFSIVALTQIFNVCLVNRKVPDSWKGAIIYKIPKKNNIPEDPSTWRDISLLPTIYEVFMKCILNRILPWLVESGTLSPNQKAYREARNE